MNEKPIWYRTLHHYYLNDYFTNGLTIPFLIGTNKVIEPNMDNISIEEFLNQLTDKSFDKKISIQRCGDIGEYVIGIVDNETINYPYGKAIVKEFGNLCFTDDSFSGILDFQQIKEKLKSIYQNKIDNSLHSINQRAWSYYTDSDISKIKEIIHEK